MAIHVTTINGIEVKTGMGVPHIPGSENIIFPQELWSGCAHKRCMG